MIHCLVLLLVLLLCSPTDAMREGMQRISVGIVGGGLSGLATAYHLAQSVRVQSLTIYDEAPGPGIGGASAVAAGLMHPFTPRARFIYRGLEGFAATTTLLRAAESHHPPSLPPLYSTAPILRPCFTPEDLETWTQGSQQHPTWLEMETPAAYQRRQRIGGQESDLDLDLGRPLGVAVMKGTVTIDTSAYLRALWLAVQQEASGQPPGGGGSASQRQCQCEWRHERVSSLAELSARHDVTVVAAGVGVPSLWSLPSLGRLGLKYVRGQNLVYPLRLRHAVLAGDYVVPSGDGGLVLAGATHEYGSVAELTASRALPDAAAAEALVGDRLAALLPALRSLRPLRATCGVRVVAPRGSLGKLPLIARHDSLANAYLLTGLGSRGVIHHAVMGQYLAAAIVAGDPAGIPAELLAKAS